MCEAHTDESGRANIRERRRRDAARLATRRIGGGAMAAAGGGGGIPRQLSCGGGGGGSGAGAGRRAGGAATTNVTAGASLGGTSRGACLSASGVARGVNGTANETSTCAATGTRSDHDDAVSKVSPRFKRGEASNDKTTTTRHANNGTPRKRLPPSWSGSAG